MTLPAAIKEWWKAREDVIKTRLARIDVVTKYLIAAVFLLSIALYVKYVRSLPLTEEGRRYLETVREHCVQSNRKMDQIAADGKPICHYFPD